MFKLRRVELLGFKSFADRSRLEFADGIAGIVGPNGCGKSNLSDAISWVLGEQSARVLRGERMADVIFNGTSSRPSTGMAEVSLTLVDPEYVDAPAILDEPPLASLAEPESGSAAQTTGSNGNGAHSPGVPQNLRHRAGEITVTRRLFRSGESEYLINGETSRLRDIQDLFMGTGLGPESYAIIEQGRIGQILSSKPSDRRAIIEEAAGVSKFKTRKRLAEAKLESSRQNLARITDILEEVTKQVNSLKRQASKARRYRELKEELRDRLKVALASRLLALDADCARLSSEDRRLVAECAAATARLEALDQGHREVQIRCDELEKRLAQCRDRLVENQLETQRLESALAQARHEIADFESRAAETRVETEKLQARSTALEQEAAQLEHRTEQLRVETEEGYEAIRRLTAEKEALSEKVSLGEVQIESLRQELIGAVSRMAELRNQLVQAEESGIALDRQLSRTRSELSSAESDHGRLSRELQSLTFEHVEGEAKMRELRQALGEASAAVVKARAEQTACQTELDGLRQDTSSMSARKGVLEESLARHSYTAESVRRLLSGEIPSDGGNFKPLGILADFVEVVPGYEEVVEEFLKSDLECVVVERHEEARSGIELLRSEGSGRSTFFVTCVPSNGHAQAGGDPAVRNRGGVRAFVRDLVRFEPRLGLNGELALPELQHAYVVDDASVAERLAGEYPNAHFLTPTGEHYHHRLVSGGRGASAGPLALRREYRELERKFSDAQAALHTTEARLRESGSRVAFLEEEMARLGELKLQEEKRGVLSGEKLRQAKETCERVSERVGVLGSEAAHLGQERAKTRDRQAELETRLDLAKSEQSRWEAEIPRANESIRELRTQLDSCLGELTEAQARMSALEERARAAETDRIRLVAQREELHGRVARLEEQSAQREEEQIRREEECRTAAARMSDLSAERQAAATELASLEQDVSGARARRDQISPSIEAERTALDAAREQRSGVQVALARAESDRDHHAQRLRDEVSAEPHEVLRALPPEAALVGDALTTAEDDVRQIKGRIEALGAVNMTALEDLQEAEERLRFLETQRQDLLASIEDTAQAIREIDAVSRQQFLEAFQSINCNFAESFRTLFGGGVGEMRLSDETDPDSGIDIAAQPPGKRLQNVLLLSGGEKALAALALLIAIFRFTPSPFCILDEVDAPLDESNVDRFTGMIERMSRHTQFILITHNKRTMEIARLLYGVTMEEAGVSKMVSVKLESREPEAVPA